MNLTRKRILLVDDDVDIRQSLAEGLKTLYTEFDVLMAENGKKALEILRAGHRIDLLLTDLKMPVMSGFELLAAVKKDFPGTRAVALTGFITPEIKKRLQAIGNYECMEKTVGIRKLLKAIMTDLPKD